jgi:hypothetical protein
VLHDGRKRHRKWLRQLAYGNALTFAKLRQQRAARGIGKRREDLVKAAILILNHVVNF